MRTKNSARPFWRRFFWPLLLVPTLVGGYLLAHVSLEIKVTEAEAQAQLDAQVAKLQAEQPMYKITAAQVHFADSAMMLKVAGEGAVRVLTYPPHTVELSLRTTGEPDYRSGSIYFRASAFDLEQFTIDTNAPSEVAKRLIAKAAEVVVPNARNSVLQNEKVKKVLDGLGVSVDVDQNDQAIAAGALLADALVEEYRSTGQRLLEASVVALLERTPLYRLGHSWTERVALAALEDIEIKDGVFTVTLTGAKLLWTLITFLLAVGVAVGWVMALLRGNGAGLGGVIAILDVNDL